MMYQAVTRAKMFFFNNNPSGRILNRFARDIENVDSVLPHTLSDVLDVGSTLIRPLVARLPNKIHFILVFFAILGSHCD